MLTGLRKEDVAGVICCPSKIIGEWEAIILLMSVRSSLWDDSPVCKPSLLLFHPQAIKHEHENEGEEWAGRGCPPQEMPSQYKLNPGPLSPWSAYINPPNDRCSSQRVPSSLFRDAFPPGEGITDRISAYSADEADGDQEQGSAQGDPATPVMDRAGDSAAECELLTTGKKSQCGVGVRRKRPREKGLRQLSERVYNIIKELERATYKEVAAQLLEELSRLKDHDQREEQNIKRRVYDALNVLIALGVLVKEGRRISCSQRSLRPLLDPRAADTAELRRQLTAGAVRVQEKQAKLRLTEEKYGLIEGLLRRNQEQPEPVFRIEFPFVGILLREESLTENRFTGSSLTMESSEPMHPFGDIDSIKWLTDGASPATA